MRRRVAYAVLLAAALFAPTRALAQEDKSADTEAADTARSDTKSTTADPGEPVRESMPPLGLLPPSEDVLVDPRMARSWGIAPPRTFIATTVDVGFVYVRPRVSFGYGRPFTSWFGMDVNPIAQTSGLGAYGGLRLEIPHFDVRVGSRYFAAFNHTFLQQRESYDRLALETSDGMPARTLTHEIEADASFGLGPGNVLLRGSGSYVTGVPQGYDVFEETLHVIVRPPVVWRARLAYVLRFGRHRQHSAGVAVDLIDIPKRDDSITIRTGPLLRVVLSRRVEIRGSFVVPVSGPDQIGLVGGDFTELGVRYRWATE
jgi:hypothetical protein